MTRENFLPITTTPSAGTPAHWLLVFITLNGMLGMVQCHRSFNFHLLNFITNDSGIALKLKQLFLMQFKFFLTHLGLVAFDTKSL